MPIKSRIHVDITVYLPDDIGNEAKAAKLNFSGLLRQAVIKELDRRKAVTQTLTNQEIYELQLENKDGNPYVGRVTGRMIAESNTVRVLLAEDERVLIYDESTSRYWESEDPESDLSGLRLDEDAYIKALAALGLKATIDI